MKYSIVVPIYNDAYLAEAFCEAVTKTFGELLGTEALPRELEVIFVDDCSPNGSYSKLVELAEKLAFVRVVGLARNFGQHVAITAGLRYTRGDFVASLNVDLEDPVDEIPRLVEAMEKDGLDFARGVYGHRDIAIGQKITSVSFNWLLNKLTGSNTPLNGATLRVMSRRFTDAYNTLQERSRYIPGLETWLGFKQGWIEIRHVKRTVGKSSYNFWRRWKLAADSIISFSDLPLRMAVHVGAWIVGGGLLLLAYVLVCKLVYGDTLTGYTSLISVIILLGGAQMVMIGLASLYIGRILREVQGRPVFVVREEFPPKASAKLSDASESGPLAANF